MFAKADQGNFTRAERVLGDVKSAKARRGYFGKARTFVRWVSDNGHEEPAFTNVGRWLQDEDADRDAPVHIPWITIDIDNVDIVEAYNDAVRTVDRLLALGYEEDRIVCSFSGSKGFHVQIDSSQIGLAPFASQRAARIFLRTYTQDVCVDDYFDPSVCTPRSLIRITGSTHEKSGLRKRSFLAGEFLSRGMDGVMSGVRGDYSGFEWPEGGGILPQPRKHLRSVFDKAEGRYRGMRGGGSSRSTTKGQGVMSKIKYGVSEGQEFGPKNFHVGRENATFLMGCMLIEEYPQDHRTARRKLEQWNSLNDPPLPIQRVKAQWRGAKRKMSDKRDTPHVKRR